MKKIILALIALSAIGCASTEYKREWKIDASNEVERQAFNASVRECSDFAYKSKVAGSRYTEYDIQVSCLQRKGYQSTVLAVSK
jgi:hypothetical protein